MANCAYYCNDIDGKRIRLNGPAELKAYLADRGLENLFPDKIFPKKAVAAQLRPEAVAKPVIKENRHPNIQSALDALNTDFGPGIANLYDQGVLNFTQGKDLWPDAVREQLSGNEEAVYFNRKAYIDLQATSKDRLPKVVLHELGEHYNLRHMLGSPAYDALQNQIRSRAKIQGSPAQKVWNDVKRLYPELKEGSDPFVAEVIAKLGESNPNAPWYRRLLAKIKSFLIDHGLGRGFISGTLTENDLHDLLRTSLNSAANQLGKDESRTYSEAAQPAFSVAPAQRSYLWNRWFGKSRMQQKGEPIKFYHGSQAEFTVFDKNRLATSTKHPTSGLGFFFSPNKGEAMSYGGKVMEVYLSIQKPYVVNSWDLDGKFQDAEGAVRFRKKLQAAGYDGVYIKDAKYAIAFEPNQVKLTENESPTFGEDVRFSRPSTTEAATEYAQDTSKQIREKLRNMSDALFAQRFAFLSVRQMVEQAKSYISNLTEYEKFMQARRAEVDSWIIRGDRIVADKWKTLDKKIRHNVNKVMQDSTLNDVDASKDWNGRYYFDHAGRDQTKPDNYLRVYTQSQLSNENQAWLDSLSKTVGVSAVGKGWVEFVHGYEHLADAIEAELKARDQKQFQDRSKGMFADPNRPRYDAHRKLREYYKAMPEDGKFVYTETNKLHNDLFDARMQALEEQINEAILDDATRTRLNKELREKMESQSLNWYYTPLKRHGDYWFYAVDDQGRKWFSSFENKKSRDEEIAEFLKINPEKGRILGQGKALEEKMGEHPGQLAESFIREVMQKTDESVGGEEGLKLQESIYQMYIDSLPEVSVRHSAMHRKGVLGFDEDAMRSFSNAIHHGASQLSNMTHGKSMERTLEDAEKALRIASSASLGKLENAKLDAAKLLRDHWDALTEEDYIANELRKYTEGEPLSAPVDHHKLRPEFKDVSEEAWNEMRKLVNRFNKVKEEDRDDAIEHLIEKEEHILEIANNIKPEDREKATDVLNELKKSYKAMVATGSSDMDRVASSIRQFNFMGTLGFSLSAGLVNMLQTPIVAMPVAAGKYGIQTTTKQFARSTAELMSALKIAYQKDANGKFINRDADNNVSISVILNKKLNSLEYQSPEWKRVADEYSALKEFKEAGDISRTQTFELIGIGQHGEEYGGKLQDLAKWSGSLFHLGERVNREITMMAAYRMARDSGMSHEDAVDESRRINNLSHGDYSSENAARIFRGWPAQIALQYKKYPQLMLYLYGSNAMNLVKSIKERNPKEGKEAAATLGGLIAMQVAFAGAMGLPLTGAATAIINGMGGLFDDPDDPFDIEQATWVWLSDLGGDKFANTVMNGLVNGYTKANLADRLSLRDIIFRENLRDVEGAEYGQTILSDLFGPTGGMFMKILRSFEMLNEGELFRAAEAATPKAIGDIVKGIRYGKEDAKSLADQHVKDMSATEVLLQAMGFSSSELKKVYLERSIGEKRKSAIKDTRQKLINAAVRAENRGEDIDWDKIDEFNEKYPSLSPITQDTITRSMLGREKYAERAEGRGYALPEDYEFLYEEYGLEPEEE